MFWRHQHDSVASGLGIVFFGMIGFVTVAVVLVLILEALGVQ
jgi:hypothetical protein